ncbi:MAG: hypothetical protein H6729_16070 [Deltaproteobacteria bacterium]|nr:hypothetical protein [Deltaproteobacteria bacterium]
MNEARIIELISALSSPPTPAADAVPNTGTDTVLEVAAELRVHPQAGCVLTTILETGLSPASSLESLSRIRNVATVLACLIACVLLMHMTETLSIALDVERPTASILVLLGLPAGLVLWACGHRIRKRERQTKAYAQRVALMRSLRTLSLSPDLTRRIAGILFDFQLSTADDRSFGTPAISPSPAFDDDPVAFDRALAFDAFHGAPDAFRSARMGSAITFVAVVAFAGAVVIGGWSSYFEVLGRAILRGTW